MINPIHMRDRVIIPTLRHIGLYSRAAERLLLCTFYHESTVGNATALQQTKGPALGVFQIEPETHKDNFEHFLNYPKNAELRVKVLELASTISKSYDEKGTAAVADYELVFNLAYATAQARIKYWRVREPLPQEWDVNGLAEYWFRYYCSCNKKSLTDFKNSVWRLRNVMDELA